MNKLFKLIERIEDAVLSGVAIPLTPWAIVNGEKLLPLLDRIRENVPEEIQAAHKVLERRETLLEEAQQQAHTVVEEAKTRSQALLSDSELMRAVREEAETVRQQVIAELESMRKIAFEESEALKRQAYEESSRMRSEAEAYAETILTSLDNQVGDLHRQLQAGKKQLHQLRMEQRTTSPIATENAGRSVPSASMTHRAGKPQSRQMPSRPESGGTSRQALKRRMPTEAPANGETPPYRR